ncbi:Transposon Ty3-I Gag-Pol polyprotein [Gossypium australe]|uniref:Transposon Ty3-I Gag-Pol polyprotein n=1 Tax=Gossypium australe TaxID=47621 RepID=A0A5B6WP86_9ROSI|nr:Transposon Ty3-I Gag-Pol polyprotein [Gossypium australe]
MPRTKEPACSILTEPSLVLNHVNWDLGVTYSVHPESVKMYRDLKKLFWWPRMKKRDIGVCNEVSNFPEGQGRTLSSFW